MDEQLRAAAPEAVGPEAEMKVGGAESAEQAAPAMEAATPAEPSLREGLTMEQRQIVAEPPATDYGWLSFMPYVAAGIVGSVVFVVTRKRVKL
jgi:hypothetical protein